VPVSAGGVPAGNAGEWQRPELLWIVEHAPGADRFGDVGDRCDPICTCISSGTGWQQQRQRFADQQR